MDVVSPRDDVDWPRQPGGRDARSAFAMIDATIVIGDPDAAPIHEVVPGEPRPARAILRVGREEMGILIGRLPATRAWERADQDLLELFASEIAVAVRNAELFARSKRRTASCSSWTRRRTTSCAGSATTCRRR